MNRKLINFYRILLLVLIPVTSFSQTERISTPELKAMGRDQYSQENYAEAYESYRVLLDRYPRDALFNYYAGMCLYHINKDISLAIKYLDLASSKPEIPEDALFFLGKAYQKNYQFREAKAAFQKFQETASKNTVKELNPRLEIMQAGNAMQLTLGYNPFEVEASSLFTFADTSYIKQVKGKGGTLSVKPAEFLAKGEEEGGMTRFMFIPKDLNRGDYLYYSAYSRAKKNGSQLYRIKKTGGQNWGDPEELQSLNTEFDEILPYFDPVSNDLYFASQGHKSMGGFDVFKAHYDTERKEWSEAVNLGFPVNSIDNEYLAMPGPDLGTFLLVTDRQGVDSLLTVYRLILKEPKKSLASAAPQELKKIGNLGGISLVSAGTGIKKEVENQGNSAASSRQKEKESNGNTNTSPNIEVSHEISSGLEYQKKADSLSILAKEARIKAKTISDSNERWALQRQIIEWEKDSKEFAEKASTSFALEREKTENKSTPDIPETIEKDKEINGITVYKYREEIPEQEPEITVENSENKKNVTTIVKEAFKTEDEPGEPVAAPSPNASDMNRLSVLDESPYSSRNPFPGDIKIPEGAFYRIQLGVFSQDVDYNNFGGLSPITMESVPGKSLTRFYAGKFNRYEEARKALETVKQNGFKDAFIVSWYNGQKTALNKVIDLEKRDQTQSEK